MMAIGDKKSFLLKVLLTLILGTLFAIVSIFSLLYLFTPVLRIFFDRQVVIESIMHSSVLVSYVLAWQVSKRLSPSIIRKYNKNLSTVKEQKSQEADFVSLAKKEHRVQIKSKLLNSTILQVLLIFLVGIAVLQIVANHKKDVTDAQISETTPAKHTEEKARTVITAEEEYELRESLALHVFERCLEQKQSIGAQQSYNYCSCKSSITRKYADFSDYTETGTAHIPPDYNRLIKEECGE